MTINLGGMNVSNITMRDIGKTLGVSAVTVSKALAGKGGVSEKMREKIIQKAQEVGYRAPAEIMAEQAEKRYDIGILMAERFFSMESFYSTMYKKLVLALKNKGHFGILDILSDTDENNGMLPHMMLTGKADGVIVIGQLKRDYLKLLTAQECPVVFLDFYDDNAMADAVVGDNSYGCYRLTNHLIKLGHKDIGFVGSIRETTSIMDRYLGYYKAMLSNNLPIEPEWTIPDRDETGKIYEQFALPEKLPTAFVCNWDEAACYLMRQLIAKGVKIPDDISIVGFDDFTQTPYPDLPALSTFKIDVDAMVAAAVSHIAELCGGEAPQNGRVVISGHPVYRDSAAKVRQ